MLPPSCAAPVLVLHGSLRRPLLIDEIVHLLVYRVTRQQVVDVHLAGLARLVEAVLGQRRRIFNY